METGDNPLISFYPILTPFFFYPGWKIIHFTFFDKLSFKSVRDQVPL